MTELAAKYSAPLLEFPGSWDAALLNVYRADLADADYSAGSSDANGRKNGSSDRPPSSSSSSSSSSGGRGGRARSGGSAARLRGRRLIAAAAAGCGALAAAAAAVWRRSAEQEEKSPGADRRRRPGDPRLRVHCTCLAPMRRYVELAETGHLPMDERPVKWPAFSSTSFFRRPAY